MEFNYLVERTRMLNSLGRRKGRCEGVPCEVCPLHLATSDHRNCTWFEGENPLEATEIVRKWAEEHPRKTRRTVFLEKFPGARLKENGSPYVCCWHLGMATKEECNGITCMDCWNTEVEE